MKDIITKEDFLAWQPCYPKITETDPYFWEMANKLAEICSDTKFGEGIPFAVRKRLSLCLTGYMQDILSDAGIWRSFVDANRQLYGWSVPFHDIPEEYIDYELNREDVRFLTWYSIAMGYEELRDINPHDSGLLILADRLFDYLESEYDDATEPETYNIARGLEYGDDSDSKEILRLGQWLFLHCYLLTPAFAMSLGEIMKDKELHKKENVTLLHDRLEKAMMEEPTGPLALYMSEWLYLILKGKLPRHRDDVPDTIHPYYEKFTAATGGREIAFFDTYENLNRFFIDALGWEKGVEHLPMFKGHKYFVLLVNKHKGMLAAKDVAKCIASPDNPYYDMEYARENAIYLLMVRGLCPGDLLQYIFRNDWLPDACFPGSEDHKLVHDNRDFIARCYLQQYYRGD